METAFEKRTTTVSHCLILCVVLTCAVDCLIGCFFQFSHPAVLTVQVRKANEVLIRTFRRLRVSRVLAVLTLRTPG